MSDMQKCLQIASVLPPEELKKLIMILVIRTNNHILYNELSEYLGTVLPSSDIYADEVLKSEPIDVINNVSIRPIRSGRLLTDEEIKELEEKANVPFFEIQEETDEETET